MKPWTPHRAPFLSVFVAIATLASVTAVPYGAQAYSAVHDQLREPAAAAPAAPAAAAQTITGASIGSPYVQPTFTKATSRNGGDTWYNTWAADGDVYATSNDTSGFSDTCPGNNLVVNELTGSGPEALANPYTNCMTSYGTTASWGNYGDQRSWKTEGIISVGGTIYLAVSRQEDGHGGYPNGYQPSDDATIVKSTDNGRTWSNSFGLSNDPNGAAPPAIPGATGAASMFPSTFTTPQFVNYGQDDNAASTADGGSQYVYAISNDGYAYDGSYAILGRVLRTQIGNLNAADWQFYTGPAGGDGTVAANWTSYANIAKATHLINAPHQLSQAGVQYVPGLGEYIMTSFYYPFNAEWPGRSQTSLTTWSFYQAPHPWGPWTQFLSAPTVKCEITCQAMGNAALGLYDPVLVSKFIAEDGLSNVIFSSGDYAAPNRADDFLYQLHAYPLTLTTSAEHQVDDTDPGVSYTGGWVNDYRFTGYDGQTDHWGAASLTSAGACASTQPAASYTFTGTSVAWVGARNHDHGIADVSVDGGAAVAVDTYAPVYTKQQVLHQRTGLASGSHTIKITLTCGKNASSTGTYEDIDSFIVGP